MIVIYNWINVSFLVKFIEKVIDMTDASTFGRWKYKLYAGKQLDKFL